MSKILSSNAGPIRFEEEVTVVCHEGKVALSDESGDYILNKDDQHATPANGGCSVQDISGGGSVVSVLNEPTDTVDPPEDKTAKQAPEKFSEDVSKAALAERAKGLGVRNRSKLNKESLAKKVKAAEKKSDHPAEEHPAPDDKDVTPAATENKRTPRSRVKKGKR